MKTKFKTREEWLMAGLEMIRPIFAEVGQKVPAKIRVSCGFPSKGALANRKRRIGECWSDKASAGKVFEIFISPVLNKPSEVLGTLVYEVVHAVVGLECGHKAPFKKVALAVGLTGKMTATEEGPELKERINGWAEKLGGYPHDQLDKMVTLKKAPDKCRLLKAECPKCGYIIRVTKKWAVEAGLPICPCGGYFETEEPLDLEDEGED